MAIKARLILRNSPTEDWESRDPVLSKGEPGYDTKEQVLKIGDGTNTWKNLKPIAGKLIANGETIGGVLSSTEENKVKVNENGTMELNKVSTSLLYVPEGEEFTLKCGDSLTS